VVKRLGVVFAPPLEYFLLRRTWLTILPRDWNIHVKRVNKWEIKLILYCKSVMYVLFLDPETGPQAVPTLLLLLFFFFLGLLLSNFQSTNAFHFKTDRH